MCDLQMQDVDVHVYMQIQHLQFEQSLHQDLASSCDTRARLVATSHKLIANEEGEFVLR